MKNVLSHFYKDFGVLGAEVGKIMLIATPTGKLSITKNMAKRIPPFRLAT